AASAILAATDPYSPTEAAAIVTSLTKSRRSISVSRRGDPPQVPLGQASMSYLRSSRLRRAERRLCAPRARNGEAGICKKSASGRGQLGLKSSCLAVPRFVPALPHSTGDTEADARQAHRQELPPLRDGAALGGNSCGLSSLATPESTPEDGRASRARRRRPPRSPHGAGRPWRRGASPARGRRRRPRRRR